MTLTTDLPEYLKQTSVLQHFSLNLQPLWIADFFPNHEPQDQTEKAFHYFIISPPRNSNPMKEMFQVSKIVPHPGYDPTRGCKSTNNSDNEILKLDKTDSEEGRTRKCDIAKISHDVALLKIERKKTKKTEDDSSYETVSSIPQSKACLNVLHTYVPFSPNNPISSSYENNMLRPPSESIAFEKSFKSKATCYAVGYSFDANGDIR